MDRIGKGVLGLAVVLLIAAPAGADDIQADYGFVIHTTAAGYGGCGTVEDADINECADIDAVGGGLNDTWFIWVFAFGYKSATRPGGEGEDPIPWPIDAGIGGAQFGIDYHGTVDVGGWSLCTGGQEIPQNNLEGLWPASGTGNAVTWPDGGYDSPSTGQFAKIGYFTVNPGSTGQMWITVDPRLAQTWPPDGAALFSSDEPLDYEVLEVGFSIGDVGGDQPGAADRSCAKDVPIIETSWGQLKSYY